MKVRLISLPDQKAAGKRNPNAKIRYKQAQLVPTSFLSSWGEGKTFCIKTYGCQANVRDSEIIRGLLLALKLEQ